MSARGRTPASAIARAADVLVRDYMAVRAGEAVLVTADVATDPELVTALLTAIDRADARGSALTIPRLPYQGRLADPYVPPVVAAAAAACAVWIDLTFPYLAGSHARDETLAGGRVRYPLGGDMGVGLGIPFWLPGGGENHPDAILSQQSLWIDGRAVVEDGLLVGPPHPAALAERLVPEP